MANLKFLIIVILNIILEISAQNLYQERGSSLGVITPCRLSKQRKFPKNVPFIRVIDELTGAVPDIVLGQGGIPYFMLPPSTPTDIVIECSSSLGRVKWSYKGRGAQAGIRVAPTAWSSTSSKSNRLKVSCYSAALVISNVTDQLTGEYSCTEIENESFNSFLLFVPQSTPFYHKEGEVLNISVPFSSEGNHHYPVTLPCISRRRSGAGISLFRIKENELEKIDIGPKLKYDPFSGFLLTPTKSLFENGTIPRFVCKFDKNLKDFKNIQNSSLLIINLILRSDEKIAPESTQVRAFSPYFSWTTKSYPEIKVSNSSDNFVGTVWQQYFTKNDFEDDVNNDSTPIYHLGSLHLLNVSKGEEGSVRLEKSGSGQLIHQWNYYVFDKANEDVVGLSYELVDTFHHVFTCVSATSEKPKITLTSLMSDEPAELFEKGSNETIEEFIVRDCPTESSLGCVILEARIPQGEVTCVGDGVKRVVRYPLGITDPSRPFFVERGETLNIYMDNEVVVTISCLPNAPESQYFAHLFRRKNDTEEYDILWSSSSPKKNWDGVEFYPNWGFHLDTSYQKLEDPSGEYLCSSSPNVEDRSDSVTVFVSKSSFSISPKESVISGTLPYSFRWASSSSLDLEVEEEGLKPFVKVEPGMWTKSELILRKGTINSTEFNITLIDTKTQSVVHQWLFKVIDSTQIGLTVYNNETYKVEDSEGGEEYSRIEIICKGTPPNLTTSSRDSPRLSYFFCQNPSTCELVKKCLDKNCIPDSRFEIEDIIPSQNCLQTNGCLRTVLKSIPLNGIFKAVCKFNGITEQKTFTDVFFREDIHWDYEKEEDLLYLYVNSLSSPTNNLILGSSDQNPLREVRSIVSNLEWEMGDTVQLSCAGAPFLFSQGVKWALETKDGNLEFQKDSIFDPQWKYSGRTQVLSMLTLVIDNFELKRVWCFVPTLDNPLQWKNISQPIFIKSEIGDQNCHEAEPSIRLINVYPPASKVNLNLNDMRLDRLPYFIVPGNVLQFSVKVTASEYTEWSFEGAGDGPTSTPLIQSDRHITSFYDESTYCYTSKMLINLRRKNGHDTGRYFVNFKNHPALDFFIFVPSNEPPYLIKSGKSVNQTLKLNDGKFILPCPIKNPSIPVQLYKKNVSSEQYENVEALYDPTQGFIFQDVEAQTDFIGSYKCVAGGNDQDFQVVNVFAEEKKAELKHERVGEIHIFTCTSQSEINKPEINLINDQPEEQKEPDQVEKKDCPGGCAMLMTTLSSGSVRCTGEGINETLTLPENVEVKIHLHPNNKTGLWYDEEEQVFKCQTISLEPPTLSGVTCRRPNECHIMQNRLETGDMSQSEYKSCGIGCSQLRVRSRLHSNWPPNWFSLFLQCKGDNDKVGIFAQYFRDKGKTTFVTKESISKFREVQLNVMSFRREGPYVQAKFRCFANRYFYSRGVQWALERVDGTLTFQELSSSVEMEVQNYSATISEMTLDVDETIYKAVWCFVPLADSSKWANASITIPIDRLVYQLN